MIVVVDERREEAALEATWNALVFDGLLRIVVWGGWICLQVVLCCF